MTAPASRLATIATCSAILAAVSLASVVAQVSRAMTSVRRMDAFSGWQRPFVDGSSADAAFVGIASLVLLLMLPLSGFSWRTRRATTLLLAAGAFLNFALGIGYAFVSGTFDEPPDPVWGRPSVLTIVLEQMPEWGLAVTVMVVLVNGRPWIPRQAPEETAGPPAVGEYLGD